MFDFNKQYSFMIQNTIIPTFISITPDILNEVWHHVDFALRLLRVDQISKSFRSKSLIKK